MIEMCFLRPEDVAGQAKIPGSLFNYPALEAVVSIEEVAGD
jgi:hypothetical protein